MRRPTTPTLFPYTTLFRSVEQRGSVRPGARGGWQTSRRGSGGDAARHPERWPPREGFLRAAAHRGTAGRKWRSEEHTSELQSQSNLVCRLLLENKKIPMLG